MGCGSELADGLVVEADPRTWVTTRGVIAQ